MVSGNLSWLCQRASHPIPPLFSLPHQQFSLGQPKAMEHLARSSAAALTTRQPTVVSSQTSLRHRPTQTASLSHEECSKSLKLWEESLPFPVNVALSGNWIPEGEVGQCSTQWKLDTRGWSSFDHVGWDLRLCCRHSKEPSSCSGTPKCVCPRSVAMMKWVNMTHTGVMKDKLSKIFVIRCYWKSMCNHIPSSCHELNKVAFPAKDSILVTRGEDRTVSSFVQFTLLISATN